MEETPAVDPAKEPRKQEFIKKLNDLCNEYGYNLAARLVQAPHSISAQIFLIEEPVEDKPVEPTPTDTLPTLETPSEEPKVEG